MKTKTIEQLERELFAYHAAVAKAREMGLLVPTIIEIADLVAFPKEDERDNNH